MSEACKHKSPSGRVDGIDPERVNRANRVYCQACEENGVKVCSWESFSAWKEYVDGKIAEPELTQRAREEVKHFTDTFKKYTIVDKEEASPGDEAEAQKALRAKKANKIYKQACTESGLSLCFFNNFSSWSDYVQGKIDDEQFQKLAHFEAGKMVADSVAGKSNAD